MPSSESILAGLTRLANDWQWLAAVFHAYLAVLIVLIVANTGITKRLIGVLLSVPLACVSFLAWISMNPFNGFMFAAVTIALLVLSLRLPAGAVHLAPAPVAIAGFLLLGFGWVYPHFLNTSSFMPYLYSAPVAVVPCPTLSAVIGLALVAGALERRPWGIVLAALGIFYGLVGTLRLDVGLDWVLVVGAGALLAYCLVGVRAPSEKAARA